MDYIYNKGRKQFKSSNKNNKRPIIQQNYSESERNLNCSQDSNDENQYLDKIQSIWKNIKNTKKMSVHNNPSRSNSSEDEDETISYRNNKQLKDSINQELDSAKYQQNIQVLMKKLISVEQQVQYLQYELQKQINDKEPLRKQLKRLRNNLQSRQKQNQSNQLNQNYMNQQSFFIQQQKDKRTIQKYQFKIKALTQQLDDRNLEINRINNQNLKLENQLQNVKQSKFNVNVEKNDFNFKGSEILELNQAYKAIQRLVTLIKSTDEYKSFGNFAEQFKSIHFLQNIPKRLKQSALNVKLNSKNRQLCNCMQVRINEKLLWAPMLCYKKMLEMKLKYNTLNQDCIEQVLFQMNRLYISKQETRVIKLKNFYQNQILKLKKKTQLTYDQILAKKQIQRLKKALTSKKKGQKRTSIIHNDSQEKETNKYQKLRAIGQYEDELKLKQRQIKLLQERIKLFESQHSTYDKSLYMEGVLWIIDKLLQELDLNNQNIRSFENIFRKKINTAASPVEWLRSYKQLFQSIEELSHTLIQKILTIKETTIKKMSSHS